MSNKFVFQYFINHCMGKTSRRLCVYINGVLISMIRKVEKYEIYEDVPFDYIAVLDKDFNWFYIEKNMTLKIR